MALIRLQNKVPNIYVDKSRDFQLLLRLFDVIFNGIKYDIDGITRLVNSDECKSNILQLLQTKVGFFSDKDFTDTTLRYIIRAFPALIKEKGTKLAIEQAVYVFLKISGIETNIEVDVIEGQPTASQKRFYGSKITDHCVVIGIKSNVKDITPLKEVLKYIVPFGYNLFFYFFAGQEVIHEYTHTDKAEFILVSDNVNNLAGSVPVATHTDGSYVDWDPDTAWYTKSLEDRLIGAINTVETQYSDSTGNKEKPEFNPLSPDRSIPERVKGVNNKFTLGELEDKEE